MSTVRAAEVPPPGVGVKTVTVAVPATAMSPAEIAALSWEADTSVVGRSEPFQRTTDPYTKPEPLTVRVKSGSAAMTVDGTTLTATGAG